jgi:hypothetical protein
MPDKPAGLTLDIERTGTTVIVRCHGRLTSDVDDILYSRVRQLLADSKNASCWT